MIANPELPTWCAILVSLLLLLGSALTLTGSIGLLSLSNFYQRVHAPTLGATLGVGCVLCASMLLFSVMQTRLVVHEVLITVFVIMTTPVTLMVLVRAALHREQSKGE